MFIPNRPLERQEPKDKMAVKLMTDLDLQEYRLLNAEWLIRLCCANHWRKTSPRCSRHTHHHSIRMRKVLAVT